VAEDGVRNYGRDGIDWRPGNGRCPHKCKDRSSDKSRTDFFDLYPKPLRLHLQSGETSFCCTVLFTQNRPMKSVSSTAKSVSLIFTTTNRMIIFRRVESTFDPRHYCLPFSFKLLILLFLVVMKKTKERIVK